MSFFHGLKSGLKIKGCWEPRAPFNSPVVPLIFCREPKDVLVSLHNTFSKLSKIQFGSLEKKVILSPDNEPSFTIISAQRLLSNYKSNPLKKAYYGGAIMGAPF